MPNILPVSDLRNYNEVLKNCQVGEPVFLTKNGRGKFVVMDIEDYEREKAEKKLLMKLQEAEEAVKDESAWMSLDELKKSVPGIDWDAFLSGVGVKGVTELSVSQVDPIKEVEKIINTIPVEKQVAYMQWKLINRAASYLSDEFVAQNFDFYGKTLSGRKENQPRWKRAVGTVNGMLGEAVGQMYVEKYFPAAAKERMVQLVKNLQTALGERIQN